MKGNTMKYIIKKNDISSKWVRWYRRINKLYEYMRLSQVAFYELLYSKCIYSYIYVHRTWNKHLPIDIKYKNVLDILVGFFSRVCTSLRCHLTFKSRISFFFFSHWLKCFNCLSTHFIIYMICIKSTVHLPFSVISGR